MKAAIGVILALLAGQTLRNGLSGGSAAPDFSATSSDGKTYSLKDLTKKAPVYLYFVKDGCMSNPYSVKYFNRLHDAYKGKVQFFTVMNSGKDPYAAFQKQYKAEFPGLYDPEKSIIRAYNIHRSQTVLLVGEDGKVVTTFKGFGKAALDELNASMASVAKVPVQKVDFSDAPGGTAYG